MIISKTGPGVIVSFIMTDMLSLVFGLLVVIATRKTDVFEDQKQYLLKINSQDKQDGGWQDE